MLLRILSALVLVPVALAVVYFAPPAYYLAALGIVGSLCLHEFYAITARLGRPGQPWFGHAAFWFVLLGLYTPWLPAPVVGAVLLPSAFLAALLRGGSMKDCFSALSTNLLGVTYLGFCLFPAFALRFQFGERQGMAWTFLLLAVIWAGDTAALFAGRSFGRTPFAPRLSPKKTNEGAAAGLLAGVAAAVLVQRLFFPDLALLHVVAASILIGIFGQLGDLSESMLKRAAEVKESSYLIPGHGGVLDRIDSLLFAFPVLYLYLLVLNSGT